MRRQVASIVASLSILLAASACRVAGPIKNMREVALGAPAPAPEAGKALVVFVRPPDEAHGVQASVFEIVSEQPRLVGINASATRVACQVDPGTHLFMVVSESGDCLTADVAAGKTYYARIVPRMGAWRARFSLQAVSGNESASEEFVEELAASRWVECGPESQVWAASNAASIENKYTAYYPKWITKADADRPHLGRDEGR